MAKIATAAAPRKSRPSRTYAERMAAGRPTVSFTLSTETVEIVYRLAIHHRLSRSAVIELAVRELDKRRKDSPEEPET